MKKSAVEVCPGEHHLQGSSPAILVGGGKFHNKNFYNHLTSINWEIMCCNDGNVPIARKLLDALQAKIAWDLLTP